MLTIGVFGRTAQGTRISRLESIPLLFERGDRSEKNPFLLQVCPFLLILANRTVLQELFDFVFGVREGKGQRESFGFELLQALYVLLPEQSHRMQTTVQFLFLYKEFGEPICHIARIPRTLAHRRQSICKECILLMGLYPCTHLSYGPFGHRERCALAPSFVCTVSMSFQLCTKFFPQLVGVLLHPIDRFVDRTSRTDVGRPLLVDPLCLFLRSLGRNKCMLHLGLSFDRRLQCQGNLLTFGRQGTDRGSPLPESRECRLDLHGAQCNGESIAQLLQILLLLTDLLPLRLQSSDQTCMLPGCPEGITCGLTGVFPSGTRGNEPLLQRPFIFERDPFLLAERLGERYLVLHVLKRIPMDDHSFMHPFRYLGVDLRPGDLFEDR